MEEKKIRPYPEGIAWDEAWRQRQRADALEECARSVLQMEVGIVNDDKGEPYDPIANPGVFDWRIVRLAQALESHK